MRQFRLSQIYVNIMFVNLYVKGLKIMNDINFNFFISYNHKDEEYATWIAYLLEEDGYKTFYQAWDFKAGNNFILEMQKGAKCAHHTLALISENYLSSLYTQPEWAAAFGSDPTGELRKLIPVRIQDIELEGLLPQIIYIDLVGKNEEKAKEAILTGVSSDRKKPTVPPRFPGIIPNQKKNESDETYIITIGIDGKIKNSLEDFCSTLLEAERKIKGNKDFHCHFLFECESIVNSSMQEHSDNKLFVTKSKNLLDEFDYAKEDLNTLLELLITSQDVISYSINDKFQIFQRLVYRRIYDLIKNRVGFSNDKVIYYQIQANPYPNNTDNKVYLCCSSFIDQPFDSFEVYIHPEVYESLPNMGLVVDLIPHITLVNDVYPSYFWHKYRIKNGSKEHVPDLYHYCFNKSFLP